MGQNVQHYANIILECCQSLLRFFGLFPFDFYHLDKCLVVHCFIICLRIFATTQPPAIKVTLLIIILFPSLCHLARVFMFLIFNFRKLNAYVLVYVYTQFPTKELPRFYKSRFTKRKGLTIFRKGDEGWQRRLLEHAR